MSKKTIKTSKNTKTVKERATSARQADREVPYSPLETVHVDIKFKNEAQKDFYRKIENNKITICAGSPGTGKTLVACAAALKIMKAHPELYNRIVLVKSVTSLEGEEVGYLKGTLAEKLEPYVASFVSNFEKLVPKAVVSFMRQHSLIEVQPIAFIRGINLDSCIVLVDECQNVSARNMRTIMTRIGSDCKMVLMGDIEQTDIKLKSASALPKIIRMFDGVDEVGVCTFDESHIVRDPIVKVVEAKFREHFA